MAQSTENGIHLDQVTFGYPGAKPIIDQFSLEVRPGSFTVIVGASGCGKTTLLNLIAGFLSPVDGEVVVGGKVITGPGPDRGVVFQGDSSLLGWRTVEDNVGFGLAIAGVKKSERQERTRRALETVGLAADHRKYPRELSGGMKQRVQIARALVSDAPILLMDEPFGALDAITRGSLQAEIARIWTADRRTVVFITHDIGEAITLGDQICVMRKNPDNTVHFKQFDNELPRPRHKSDEAFGRLYDVIESNLNASATGSSIPTSRAAAT
ncbi:ABC transporter ATP-binding protein [Agromyces silvae]|uniref:ABC transporter ATP-binding protein n=1 Tax=Agromyces silvae TaxID=3388266 RepID=UPI00280B6E0D|nr:ABC transporter ATP-binding protein [Agromyces protaetiae]